MPVQVKAMRLVAIVVTAVMVLLCVSPQASAEGKGDDSGTSVGPSTSVDGSKATAPSASVGAEGKKMDGSVGLQDGTALRGFRKHREPVN